MWSDNCTKQYRNFGFILLNHAALKKQHASPLHMTWGIIHICRTNGVGRIICPGQQLSDYLYQRCPDTAARKTWEGAEGLWEIDEESCVIFKSWKRVVVSETDGWSRWKKKEKAKQAKRNSYFEGAALCMRPIMSSIKTLLAGSVSLALSDSFVSLWTREAVWRLYCFSRKRYECAGLLYVIYMWEWWRAME